MDRQTLERKLREHEHQIRTRLKARRAGATGKEAPIEPVERPRAGGLAEESLRKRQVKLFQTLQSLDPAIRDSVVDQVVSGLGQGETELDLENLGADQLTWAESTVASALDWWKRWSFVSGVFSNPPNAEVVRRMLAVLPADAVENGEIDVQRVTTDQLDQLSAIAAEARSRMLKSSFENLRLKRQEKEQKKQQEAEEKRAEKIRKREKARETRRRVQELEKMTTADRLRVVEQTIRNQQQARQELQDELRRMSRKVVTSDHPVLEAVDQGEFSLDPQVLREMARRQMALNSDSDDDDSDTVSSGEEEEPPRKRSTPASGKDRLEYFQRVRENAATRLVEADQLELIGVMEDRLKSVLAAQMKRPTDDYQKQFDQVVRDLGL